MPAIAHRVARRAEPQAHRVRTSLGASPLTPIAVWQGGRVEAPDGQGTAEPSSAVALRGEVPPNNNLEKIQVAYLHAVATGAGCTIGKYDFDDGIDAVLKHRVATRTPSQDAHLEVQLKCTSSYPSNPASGRFSVTLSNDRFNLFAEENPSIKKIVVGMIVPKNVEDWVECDDHNLLIRHCCYWKSIIGEKPSGQESTSVQISTAQRFDVLALCAMMTRIGEGGNP